MEIKLEHVYYRSSHEVKDQLMDMNLSFAPSKIYGILGNTESGKTTLLELIDGLLDCTSGTILYDGISKEQWIHSDKTKNLNQKIGYVFKEPQEQFFNRTVRQEIQFAMRLYCGKRKEDRLSNVLKMVGLNDSYLDKDPFYLSRGEQKKIALASILIYNPEVILLDEPSISLDEISIQNLIKLMRVLKNRFHKTIIITSKDSNFLHQFVDDIYVMESGKIIKNGTKYEIFTDIEFMRQHQLMIPSIIAFEAFVEQQKKVQLGYRDQVNDLIKDIYRNAK